MRIGYLECFAGVSGDMFLGALVDAGADFAAMNQAAASLNLGAGLRMRKVDRSGIHSTKVDVLLHGEPAQEGLPGTSHLDLHTHEHPQEHSHSHDHKNEHTHSHDDHEPAHKGSHSHAHEEGHDHNHSHSHGRSLSVIRTLIEGSQLAPETRRLAMRAFDLLGTSEARIHNVPVEKIHFHEVGAVDAIVDIVAACEGIRLLQVDAWVCSPLNVGGGLINCAHGQFPVPAPAVLDLLQGAPTYSSGMQMELVTPTGAALVRALGCTFSAFPPMRISSIGYGAGTRDPKNFPNVLRISVGESENSVVPVAEEDASTSDTVTVLETAVDDLNPQVIGNFAQLAYGAGALDVTLSPVQMKKGRPGTQIVVLCRQGQSARLQEMMFRELSTLGIRVRQEQRVTLERRLVEVETEWGKVRIKAGYLRGEEVNAAPEYEDCRTAALARNVPVKLVMEAAMLAYRGRQNRDQRHGLQTSRKG